MKKILICLTVTMSVVLFAYGFSYAISGPCSGCHTMHASQNGSWIGDADILQHRSLLKFGCIACHTGSTGEKNGDAPIVYHTSAPTGQGAGKTLAGGDFYWVTQVGGDNKGHNVLGVGSVGQDQLIGNNGPGYVPPGWDASATSVGIYTGQLHRPAGVSRLPAPGNSDVMASTVPASISGRVSQPDITIILQVQLPR